MDREQVAGGLIFVLFGLLFLASQLGALETGIIETFFRFWPAALIIAGLSILFIKK